MKKLSLSKLNLNSSDILTREQLKGVLGGVEAPPPLPGGGGSGSSCYQCCWDNYPNDCSKCVIAGSDWTCVTGASLKSCTCS